MAAKNSIGLGGVTNLAVLAPIKSGFVEGFETITYLDRLRRLLNAMHWSRQNVRESELRRPVFPDSIGRFGIIQNFRYAIVPPPTAAGGSEEPGTSLLSLNVSFDGGWEPYMRVIYRDIGTLLDALFCHCVDYPGSTRASFAEYCRWVRSNEVDGGIFYTDSPVTLGDQRYLADIERLQRESIDPEHPEAADETITRFALESDRQQVMRAFAAVSADPVSTLALSLRTLKGLYRLSTYFPDNTDDGAILIRFAQSVLKEFRQVIAQPALMDSDLGRSLKALLADELGWLSLDKTPPPPKARQLDVAEDDLQAAMLSRDNRITHGCVVMLGIRNAVQAAAHLASLADLCGEPANDEQVRHHVAFTHAGLVSLDVHGTRLDALPQEFIDGMEARCGLLGDVRSNHPDRWARPRRHRPGCGSANGADDRIDLTSVHVVVVLRLIDPDNPSHGLHPRLAQAVSALQDGNTGLAVLAVEPTRSYRDKQPGMTTEHFGFADGFSQPQMVNEGRPRPRSDDVRRGELLLGHANDRGDGPYPPHADELLDNGTFLVMRKLRQRIDHLDAALAGRTDEQKDAVLAAMMGRRKDGTLRGSLQPGETTGNDFNFDGDPGGAACPFHSHIRRANPRDGRDYMPRILRRGMSYGPRVDTEREAERGLVFMAYCASIAEQFETIQRWIAGGNSSGVGSTTADPFLGVPRVGEKRVFRYIDDTGKVARIDLGDKPFVELAWGLYLFVPSLKALRSLADMRQPPVVTSTDPEEPLPMEPLEIWRRRLEDPDRSKAMWKRVREAHGGGVKAPPYGTLLGTQQRVLQVLKDDGSRYSVQGYGRRMQASVGLNHLGMDPAGGHDELAPLVNGAIDSIGAEQAFDATSALVKGVIDGFGRLKQPDPSGPSRVPIDLVSLSEIVLAGLCTTWVGLPEPDAASHPSPTMVRGGRLNGNGHPPRCPGHLLTASRYIFAPHPRPAALEDGPTQGQAVLSAVNELLSSGRPLGSLADDIRTRLLGIGADQDLIARNIAGVLLGFPPTVHGNFLRTMETWIDDKLLWACQQRLAEIPARGSTAFDRARRALLGPLFKTMRERPVPEMLWRCPVVGGQVVHDESQRVVLGIASALTDPEASDMLMFGGSRVTSDDPDVLKTLHACPGYPMGTGVLLGLIAGLLDAGTLRPTGSPVLLMLTRH